MKRMKFCFPRRDFRPPTPPPHRLRISKTFKQQLVQNPMLPPTPIAATIMESIVELEQRVIALVQQADRPFVRINRRGTSVSGIEKSVFSGDTPKNAHVTQDALQLPALRKENRVARKLLHKLGGLEMLFDHYIDTLNERIDLAEDVTEISAGGTGLCVEEDPVYGPDDVLKISSAGAPQRSASVRAHRRRGQKPTFGLTIRLRQDHCCDHVESFGEGWIYEEAAAEAKFWVLTGNRPPHRRDLPPPGKRKK